MELESECKIISDKLSSSLESLQKSAHDLNDLVAKHSALESDIISLREEKHDLSKNIALLSERLEGVLAENDCLAMSVNEGRSENILLQGKLDKQHELNTELEVSIAFLEESIRGNFNDQEALNTTLNTEREKHLAYSLACEQITLERDEAISAREHFEAMVIEHVDPAPQLEEAIASNKLLRENLAKAETIISALESKLQEFSGNLLDSRLSKLVEANATLDQTCADLRSQLDEAVDMSKQKALKSKTEKYPKSKNVDFKDVVKVSEFQETISTLHMDIKKMAEIIAAKEDCICECEEEIENHSRIVALLEANLQTAHAKIQQLSSECKDFDFDFKRKISENDLQRKEYSLQLGHMTLNLEANNKEIDALKESIKILSSVNIEPSDSVGKKLVALNEELRKVWSQELSANASLRAFVAKIQNENQTSQSKLNSQQKEILEAHELFIKKSEEATANLVRLQLDSQRKEADLAAEVQSLTAVANDLRFSQAKESGKSALQVKLAHSNKNYISLTEKHQELSNELEMSLKEIVKRDQTILHLERDIVILTRELQELHDAQTHDIERIYYVENDFKQMNSLLSKNEDSRIQLHAKLGACQWDLSKAIRNLDIAYDEKEKLVDQYNISEERTRRTFEDDFRALGEELNFAKKSLHEMQMKYQANLDKYDRDISEAHSQNLQIQLELDREIQIAVSKDKQFEDIKCTLDSRTQGLLMDNRRLESMLSDAENCLYQEHQRLLECLDTESILLEDIKVLQMRSGISESDQCERLDEERRGMSKNYTQRELLLQQEKYDAEIAIQRLSKQCLDLERTISIREVSFEKERERYNFDVRKLRETVNSLQDIFSSDINSALHLTERTRLEGALRETETRLEDIQQVVLELNGALNLT